MSPRFDLSARCFASSRAKAFASFALDENAVYVLLVLGFVNLLGVFILLVLLVGSFIGVGPMVNALVLETSTGVLLCSGSCPTCSY